VTRVPHSRRTRSLDFSPDGEVLAVGSWDKTTKMWNTKTWEVQENTINCRADVNCVRFSPSGEHLAIATNIYVQIWNPRTSECIAKFKAATMAVRQTTSHLRGRPITHSLFQQALVPIPPYESEIHPHGSRLGTLGVVTYTISIPLP
jgi:WD40 repeat protein